MGLVDERCEACHAGTPTLPADEAARLANELDSRWTLEEKKIVRSLRTPDFATSMALAVRIGFIAEAEGHHPDLTVSWGLLGIQITTHAAGGLTRNDFILAAKIGKLLG